MSKGKRITSIIIAVLFMLTVFQIGEIQYASAKTQKQTVKPKLQLITPPKTEYAVGERIAIKVKAPNYGGRVEYRAILWDGNKRAQREIWASTPGYYYKNWRPAGTTDFTIGWAITEPGPYSLTICVRRAGTKVSYDDYVKTNTFFIKAESQNSDNLVLEKQGQIYGPEDIANRQSVDKDIYIKGDNITLRNIIANGTIIVDSGKDGQATLENITASNIKILSGGEKSIHFINIHAKNLEIAAKNKVRVELTEGSKIENTTSNSSAILDSKNGAFGKLLISKTQDEKSEIELFGKFEETIRVEGETAITAENDSQIEKIEIAPDKKNSSILLKGGFNNVSILKESSIEVDGTIKNIDAKAKLSISTTAETRIDVLNRYGNEVNVTGDGKIIKDNVQDSSNTGEGTGNASGNTSGGGAVTPVSSKPEAEYAGVLLSNGSAIEAVKTENSNEYLVDLSGIADEVGVKTTFACNMDCQLIFGGRSFNMRAHEKRSFGPSDFGETDNNPPGVSLSNFRRNFANSKGCVSQSITLKDSTNQTVSFTFIMKVK